MKTKAAEIFDTDNLTNLPKEISVQLKEGRDLESTEKLLQLFSLQSPLTLNQIIVGMYRYHKMSVKRSTLMAKLSYLCRYNKGITRCGSGLYKKCKPGKGETGTSPVKKEVSSSVEKKKTGVVKKKRKQK